MAGRSAEVLDCAYDGLDTVYVRGDCDDAHAVELVQAYVTEHLEEQVPYWWTEVAHSEQAGTYRCLRCAAEVKAEEPTVTWRPPEACPACGARLAEDVHVPRYGVQRRTRARWGWPDAGARDEGHSLSLYVDVAARRGSFELAIVIDLDERDRVAARKLAGELAVADAVALIRGKYPEAVDIRGWHRGHTGRHLVTVEFTLPELAHRVAWLSEDPEHVLVARGEIERFSGLYGGKGPREPAPGRLLKASP